MTRTAEAEEAALVSALVLELVLESEWPHTDRFRRRISSRYPNATN